MGFYFTLPVIDSLGYHCQCRRIFIDCTAGPIQPPDITSDFAPDTAAPHALLECAADSRARARPVAAST
jgi:hypothetical protein